MKKIIILLIAFILACFNLFAQEINTCLFIGRYDKGKNGICSDRAYVQEGVNNVQEYEIRRKTFLEEHKGENPSTNFVSPKQCVVVYEFQKKISGWDCSPTVYFVKTQATIESCKKEMAVYLAKNPKEFKTQPHIVFTWQGKGETQKIIITENFGDISSKFYLIDKANGGDFIVAQISNKSSTNKAIITYKNTDGITEHDIILPGEVFTKKYAAQKLDIEIYPNDIDPKSRGGIQMLREIIGKHIINENGRLKSYQIGAVGIRG